MAHVSSTGISNTYIPPVDHKDPHSLDNASRDFLDVLQGDKRLSQAREREREQQRRRQTQAALAEEKPRGTPPSGPTPSAPAPAGVRVAPPSSPPGPLVAGASSGEAPGPRPEPPPAVGQGLPPAGALSRPGPLVAGSRLPMGAPQQPPSAGLARGPAAAQPGHVPTSPAAGATGSAPLALVDARTLAALASSAAQPAGRLVGPVAGAPAPVRVEEPAPLVPSGARVAVGQPMRAVPPLALSAATPAEVRDRIQLWMLTGVLNTTPFRFPPMEPLASGEAAPARQGVTRGVPISPLARSVPARSATPAPTELAPAQIGPANDAPGPFSPLAANDGVPALGQTMFQEIARRGGASGPPQPGPAGWAAASPQPALVQQAQGVSGREPARPAGASSPRSGARPVAKAVDIGAGEPSSRDGERGGPIRLHVPGLGPPHLR